jgi:acyl-CoA thioesterase
MKRSDYFRELLGIEILEVREGYAKMLAKIGKQHLNFANSTHGGLIFSLADCAFAEACNSGDQKAVAVQVSINYLKPSSEGDTLVAEASKTSEGKTFALYNVTVCNQNKLVATFSGLAYKIPVDIKTEKTVSS